MTITVLVLSQTNMAFAQAKELDRSHSNSLLKLCKFNQNKIVQGMTKIC